MTVTLKIAPEREAAMRREAARRGMSLEEWLLQVAEDATAGTAMEFAERHLQNRDPEAWSRRLKDTIRRYGVHANLPDEALRRENIYDDRGA